VKENNIILAKKKLEEGDYAHAIMILEDLALKHNVEAIYLLGRCYAFSLGVPYYSFIANECYNMARKLGWTNFSDAWEDLPIYYIINSGDSMENVKNHLNEFMNKVIKEIQDKNKEIGPYHLCKVQAIAFSDNVRWYHASGIVDPNDFNWRMPKIGGKTNYENLFKAINEKILSLPYKKLPVFVLVTNSDIPGDFEKGITLIKQNKYFLYSTKFVLVLDDGNDQAFTELCKFTGSNESIFNKTYMDEFIHYIGIGTLNIPIGYPEWPVSEISSSMDDIDEEIKYLISYMRE